MDNNEINNEVVSKKKGSIGIIICLIIIILGLGTYILYDKGIILKDKKETNNNSNTNNNNNNKNNNTKKEITYKIETYANSNQELFVNGNKTVIPVEHEIKEFNKVDILDDIIIADVWIPDSTSLYAIDATGKVVWFELPKNSCKTEYGDACVEVIGNNYSEAFGYKGHYYKMDGNKITFVSEVATQDPEYAACQMDEDDVFDAEYEVEYLGNGKFSKVKMLQKLTAGEYIKNNKVDCYENE